MGGDLRMVGSALSIILLKSPGSGPQDVSVRVGACRSVAFPRGPEGSSGGSRGTSLSSHYRTGGYPCEGEAFCCTVKEVSSHEDRNNNLSSSFGDLLGDRLLPRNC
ncbi:hypothetical protein GW17_00019352 [Ensete ventricosum]|nr:hypothetical protein GW17_00019352 [Ensete ventricosum]